MTQVTFAIPGDPETKTGGYIYDRRVMELLPGEGVKAALLRLPAGFPFPSPPELEATKQLLASVDPAHVIVVDGLAWGAIPLEIAKAARAKVVAMCHHPLGLEDGLDAHKSVALIATERASLALAAGVVVPSATVAQTLVARFDVPEAKIAIAEPGTDTAARAPCVGEPPILLAVGAIVPRKGYDVLAQAMAQIADIGWRLVIAGSPDRAPEHARALQALVASSPVSSRIVFAGEVDAAQLEELYRQADIFVSASRYEGFGMALTEALARGLPIVASTGGAAAQTLPDAAALKIPPGESGALARALRALIEDKALRRKLSDGAWEAASKLPRWTDTARCMAQAIRRVQCNSRPARGSLR